jgi:hypothetical protein
MAGWVSRSFDRREAAATIVWQARLTGSSVLRTQIVIPQSSRTAAFEAPDQPDA